MPRIIVLQAFKFAHGGYRVEEFDPSDEPVDTTAECAELAIAEGWADDADRLEAERQAAERAEAERQAAERAEAERQAAERAEAERQAAEQAAKQPDEKAEPAAPANKDAAPKRSTKAAA